MEKHKILGIIPARGGSKSVPKKNIKELAGKPLLAWTIEEAKKSNHTDRVIVSTDDEETADIARQYGAEVPFMRPAEISQDLSTDIEFLTHALDFLKENENYEPDIVVLLRTTSPLKTAQHIDKGIELLINTPDADAVRPIVESPKHPYKMWKIADDKKWIEPFLSKDFTGMDEPYNSNRQLLPDVYVPTGAMDVMHLKTIRELKSTSGKKTAYFTMKPEESVNIDNLMDFKVAEVLMKERKKNN
jgi:CMP-N-acetylneuraminic acid synthetase